MCTDVNKRPLELDSSLAAVFAEAHPSFAERFYGAMFGRHPEYRPLFSEKDMVFQGTMLTIALQTLVESYGRPSAVAREYLRMLGQKHRSMGITAKDYDCFFQVLLDELARLHDSGWTPSLAGQWQAAFEWSASIMLDGESDEPQELHAKQLTVTADIIHGLNIRVEQASRLYAITEQINHGVVMDDVLEHVYEDFKGVIPYNRIGLALIDDARGEVISVWARSDRPIHLGRGYKGKLAGSTLAKIVQSELPRIINDLEQFLAEKPNSRSTQLVVREGMKSSLTCPLIARAKPVGFLFFSSSEKDAYQHAHVELFQGLAGQLSVIVDKARLYSQLQQQASIIDDQNRRLTKGLELAKKLQQSMIPRQDIEIPCLAIEFAYEPATNVGGDFLDIVALPDGRALVFIADAMGHGVQAAMMAAAVKTAWNNARRTSDDPVAILRQINIDLCELVDDCFVTAVCASLEPLRKELRVACAGHPPPWHHRYLSRAVGQCGEQALPLGVDAAEEYRAGCVPLNATDLLVFATDGILEAANEAGEQFGQERLARLIAEQGTAMAGELRNRIRAEVSLHTEDRPLDDDLTLIVVQVLDGEDGAERSSAANRHAT